MAKQLYTIIFCAGGAQGTVSYVEWVNELPCVERLLVVPFAAGYVACVPILLVDFAVHRMWERV